MAWAAGNEQSGFSLNNDALPQFDMHGWERI